MGQDLFTYLPSEIILNILTRLHARTIMSCKCVCKPWLNLLETPEFIKSHISKSVMGLAMFLGKEKSKPYKIVEVEDEHRWNIVFNLDLPFLEPLHSSANGLLFLCQGGYRFVGGGVTTLCYPITRDYITIPSPLRQPSSKPMLRLETYGFGVSRMSGQYKVVRISIEFQIRTSPDQFKFQVYTVGSGSWRGIASCGTMSYEDNMVGAFVNGNLHWLAREGSSIQISCLDLESELFRTFSPPPLDDPQKIRGLSVLGDCLCVCDNSWQMCIYDIDIWLMKEYEDEKSWTKEFVIRIINLDDYLGFICPIKVFKDGDILMKLGCSRLVYYCSKTKTIQESDDELGLETNVFSTTTNFAPSFLSLKTFTMENVSSF